jgi:hypothetical protein
LLASARWWASYCCLSVACIQTVPGILAVAGGPAVTGFPAVDDVLAVASFLWGLSIYKEGSVFIRNMPIW